MKEKWILDGRTPIHGANRNGCRWNDEEDRDLEEGWRSGLSTMRLAVKHQRLQSAIESRLVKISERNGGSYRPGSNPAGGTEVDKANHWTSRDGRVQKVADMDLSHLLNVANDANYRVELMRRRALGALGNDRNNVNEKTLAAFDGVTAREVFPAWDEIVRHTTKKFHDVFGVALFEVRKYVYRAWRDGTPVPERCVKAVQFYLMADQRRHSSPTRMSTYLVGLTPKTEDEFRTMCWNLRIDAPDGMKFAESSEVTRYVVPGRHHSALKTAPPPGPLSSAFDLFFNSTRSH